MSEEVGDESVERRRVNTRSNGYQVHAFRQLGRNVQKDATRALLQFLGRVGITCRILARHHLLWKEEVK